MRASASRDDVSPRALPQAQDALFGLLENAALRIAFRIEEHVPALLKLHRKYRIGRCRSLSCIIRMTEIYERHAVLTLYSDFTVYRKHGRVPLVLLHPSHTQYLER